jgi:N-acetylmuramoyl-L-alanine amidase
MVAVGSVVVNRVQDNEWPSTIKSVINQVAGGYYQFTPVKNGHINKPASSDALRAAKEALNGADPSFGAQFFFDDSSTSSWLWSRDITARYDNMIFAK